MTVRELINELLSFEPSDWVVIDGEKLRVSSEVCDSFILMTKEDESSRW
jgi:hypothetical protein